jgi:hypothetical protein
MVSAKRTLAAASSQPIGFRGRRVATSAATAACSGSEA